MRGGYMCIYKSVNTAMDTANCQHGIYESRVEELTKNEETFFIWFPLYSMM